MRPFPEPNTITTNQPGPDERPRVETLTVSMFGEHLVICPPVRLDLETTEVLVAAAASAVAAGATVMIDLDPETASDQLLARRPLGTVVPQCVGSDDDAVVVQAAGLVRLTARDVVWTIDLEHGRMYRSDVPIERCFVRPADWTGLHALWVSPTHVNALTTDGRHLSAVAAWKTRDSRKRPVSA